MAKLKLMERFDNKLLTLTDKIKVNPEYLKIQDQFGNLDDQSQSAIKLILPFAIIGLPLLIAFILWTNNSSLKEEAELKKNIISEAQEIISVRASIANAEGRVLGSGLIEQIEQFQQRIVSAVSTVAIDTSKIQLSNFSSTPLSGDINEAKVDMKFNSLTNEELFGMIGTLARSKMRVDTIQVRKSNENNLLEGLLSLVFFSKDLGTGEE